MLQLKKFLLQQPEKQAQEGEQRGEGERGYSEEEEGVG